MIVVAGTEEYGTTALVGTVNGVQAKRSEFWFGVGFSLVLWWLCL